MKFRCVSCKREHSRHSGPHEPCPYCGHKYLVWLDWEKHVRAAEAELERRRAARRNAA